MHSSPCPSICIIKFSPTHVTSFSPTRLSFNLSMPLYGTSLLPFISLPQFTHCSEVYPSSHPPILPSTHPPSIRPSIHLAYSFRMGHHRIFTVPMALRWAFEPQRYIWPRNLPLNRCLLFVGEKGGVGRRNR